VPQVAPENRINGGPPVAKDGATTKRQTDEANERARQATFREMTRPGPQHEPQPAEAAPGRSVPARITACSAAARSGANGEDDGVPSPPGWSVAIMRCAEVAAARAGTADGVREDYARLVRPRRARPVGSRNSRDPGIVPTARVPSWG
jgi:hypothetical protein